MNYPLFFSSEIAEPGSVVTMPEETSRHLIGVLRMTEGERIGLTDGRGLRAVATISDPHKKRTGIRVESIDSIPASAHQIHIAISLLKNTARFEWFLEKATEIGVTHIYPLLCDRTEKQHFRLERMNGVVVSAMLQSQQCWMPLLSEPVKLKDFLQISLPAEVDTKLIAHCVETEKRQLVEEVDMQKKIRLILIGPEGDFTNEEIELSISKGFRPVALGQTRLRSETAGVVAATVLRQFAV